MFLHKILNNSKIKIIIVLFLFSFSFLLLNNVWAAELRAEPVQEKPSGLLENVSDECYNSGDCTLCDIMQVFVTIATKIFELAGIVALIMFIWGGLELIMSQGFSERVQRGRQRMRGAVVGMLIIIFAWLLIGSIITVLVGGQQTQGQQTQGQPKQKGLASKNVSEIKVGISNTIIWYQLPKCSKERKKSTNQPTN